MIQLSNAISFGLKEGDKYAWYGVWDIWRRIPFVALTSVTTETNATLVHTPLLSKSCVVVVSVCTSYNDVYVPDGPLVDCYM